MDYFVALISLYLCFIENNTKVYHLQTLAIDMPLICVHFILRQNRNCKLLIYVGKINFFFLNLNKNPIHEKKVIPHLKMCGVPRSK